MQRNMLSKDKIIPVPQAISNAREIEEYLQDITKGREYYNFMISYRRVHSFGWDHCNQQVIKIDPFLSELMEV